MSGLTRLTAVELFAGAGGMSMGLEAAGIMCVGHAEINPDARAVLGTHYPDTPLYGDVSELGGSQFRGVPLISGGSPCQDLSVAGRRAGMVEGTRSNLFHQQIRIWRESRADFCLWENVPGAFSSNKGKDFAAVLSAFVGGAVIVPRDGWPGAGVVSGPDGVAAWRVLDAQWFGVPQRRRRVFVLCSRASRVDPAEVLLEPQSMPRDTPPRRETGEGSPANLGASSVGEGSVTLFQVAHGEARRQAVASTINANSGPNRHGQGSWSATQFDAVVAFDTQQITSRANRSRILPGPTPTLNQAGGMHVFNETGHEQWRAEQIAGSLNAHEAKEFHTIVGTGSPRRLTPRECERLMGWPDDWTLVERNGRLLSDTARYRLCGNGVVKNVAEWIGLRLLQSA